MATFKNLNAIVRSDLTSNERLLLLVLELGTCKKRTIRISVATMAERSGLGVSTVRRTLAQLAARGAFAHVDWHGKKGKKVKVYHLPTPLALGPLPQRDPSRSDTPPPPERDPYPSRSGTLSEPTGQSSHQSLPNPPPRREPKVDRLVRVMESHLDGQWPEDWDPDSPESVRHVVAIAKRAKLSGRATDVEAAMRILRSRLIREAAAK